MLSTRDVSHPEEAPSSPPPAVSAHAAAPQLAPKAPVGSSVAAAGTPTKRSRRRAGGHRGARRQ